MVIHTDRLGETWTSIARKYFGTEDRAEQLLHENLGRAQPYVVELGSADTLDITCIASEPTPRLANCIAEVGLAHGLRAQTATVR
jgi:hypothetical protein